MICDICMYDSYTYAVMHFESHVCDHFCNIFYLEFDLYWFCFVKAIQNGGGGYFLRFWCKNGIRAAPNRVAFRSRR